MNNQPRKGKIGYKTTLQPFCICEVCGTNAEIAYLQIEFIAAQKADGGYVWTARRAVQGHDLCIRKTRKKSFVELAE